MAPTAPSGKGTSTPSLPSSKLRRTTCKRWRWRWRWRCRYRHRWVVGGWADNLQLVSMNSAAVLQAPRAAASRHSESKSLQTGGTCIDGRARGIGTMPCASLLGCRGCPSTGSASANMAWGQGAAYALRRTLWSSLSSFCSRNWQPTHNRGTHSQRTTANNASRFVASWEGHCPPLACVRRSRPLELPFDGLGVACGVRRHA